MDPATIIGTTGAIVSIVDVLAKRIRTLRGLRTRWTVVDLTVSNLITQLSSLKAALNKISEWIQSDLSGSPQHYQLVMDLEEAVVCCQLLVESIDNKIELLTRDSANELGILGKVRTFFSDGDFNTFQTFIERQISALNLLLTACNCKTLSEQKFWIDKPDFRKTIDQVRDDSSSLIVLCDTLSLISRRTDTTTSTAGFSAVFPFDSELMGSQVYQRAVRRLFKRGTRVKNTAKLAVPSQLRLPETPSGIPVVNQLSQRPEISHDAVAKRRFAGRNDYKVMLTGFKAHGLYSILWTLQNTFDENKSAVRDAIQAQTISKLQTLYEKEQYKFSKHPGMTTEYSTTLALLRLYAVNPKRHPKQFMAVQELWKGLPRNVKNNASPSMKALMNRAHILAESTYQPTLEDIENALNLTITPVFTTTDIKFRIGELTCGISVCQHHFNILARRFVSSEQLWTICYVVDLATYHRNSIVAIKDSKIIEDLQSFKAVSESRRSLRKSAIIFFTNFGQFEAYFTCRSPQEQEVYPMWRRDPKKALSYIIRRFEHICEKPFKLYPYVVGIEDGDICRNFENAMKDIVRQQFVESIYPSPKNKPHPLGRGSSGRTSFLDETDDDAQTTVPDPYPIEDDDLLKVDSDKVSETGPERIAQSHEVIGIAI